MIKHVLISLVGLSLSAAPSLAQVPNASFENWSDQGFGFDDPDGWMTFNTITYFSGGVLCCEQTSPGAIGTYCAKVTTRNIPDAGGNVPGMMYTCSDPTGVEGFPWNQHSAALNFQWKYDVQPGDQAAVTVTMSRWNTSTGQRDVLGYGLALATGTQGTWQAGSAVISWSDEAMPDTANIYVLSSASQAAEGSTVSVDAFAFGLAVGVATQPAAPAFALYPSPASDVVNIVSQERIANVRVVDLTGRTVLSSGINEPQVALNVAALPAATYIALIRFADGRIATRMFSKR